MKCLEQLQILSRSFVIFTIFVIFCSLCYGAEIKLKEDAVVNPGYITLKEVSKIDGTNFEKEILSNIKLIKVRACSQKVLSKEDIAGKIAEFLRKNGVYFREIRVAGSEYVRIKSPCLEINKDHIRKIIENFLKKNYPEYEITSVPNIKIKLPATKYREKLTLDSLSGRYARFIYEIYTNGKLLKKFWIPVRVERKVKVVVAVKPIPRNSKISSQDVTLKDVVESKARGGTGNIKAIVGATARRDILPGDVIKERDVIPNFAVKRNLPVRIIYERGNLRIELLGIAKQDGFVGDIIKVKNPSTGKVILCRVIGNGLVEFVSD